MDEMTGSGRASPNQTTPGRWRPVLQTGQWGRVEGGIGMFSVLSLLDWAVVVLEEGARRVSAGDVIARDGWKGSL